jgi:hypothetical protein
MAEELALQQVFRQGHAVHDDKRHLVSSAPAVDGVGEDLLAGAALTQQQDRRRRCGGLPRDLYGLPYGRTFTQDLRGMGVQSIPQEPVGLDEPPVLQRLPDDDLEMMGVERLREEIVGALPHSLDSRFDGAVGRDDDDTQVHGVSAQCPQNLHTAHPGHLEVEEHECGRFLPQGDQSVLSIGRHDRLVSQGPQTHVEQAPRSGVIIRNQDSRAGSVHDHPFAASSAWRPEEGIG